MASVPLANTESNVDGWKSIQLDANEENAMTFLDKVIKLDITSKNGFQKLNITARVALL